MGLEVPAKPIGRQARDRFERPGFFKEVRSAGHDLRAKFHICAGIVMKLRPLMRTLLIGFGCWE
jgi:hypothetical protein